MKIAIVGAGGWGTALALLWHRAGRACALWTPFEAERDAIRSDGENRRVLPGVGVPEDLPILLDPDEALGDAKICVLAVPSKHMRNVVARLAKHFPADATIVSAAKGFDRRSGAAPLRMSEVIREELGRARSSAGVAVLSGPSHAEEVARGVPTAIVAAGANAEALREAFSTKTFRVYTSDDPCGVELGGALKNPIAIAAGVSAGLGFGDNALGALVTRGMVEISRLGAAAGANPRTFAGLSGIGDLVATCSSRHSRNRRVGTELASGKPLAKILEDLGGMVAEGVEASRTVAEWSRNLGVDTPITDAVARMLFEGSGARDELEKLMGRALKHEF